MPTLDIVMSPKEAKAAAVCIRFSYRGDYMAVGFNNEYRDEDLNGKKNFADLGQRDPSFVLIYVNRLSKKNPGIKLNSRDPYVKLMILRVPLNEFQTSSSIRKQLAVTCLDFSKDDNCLQMCI